jgi:hypothetical protein
MTSQLFAILFTKKRYLHAGSEKIHLKEAAHIKSRNPTVRERDHFARIQVRESRTDEIR